MTMLIELQWVQICKDKQFFNEIEEPFVGTGIEGRLARDSRVLMMATHSGIVAYVSASKVVVSPDGKLSSKNDSSIQEYELRKFMHSNAGTCLNQTFSKAWAKNKSR